ncbi:Ig-like domain-containing protein [Actinoallomurus purpureus]|uniref:L,D-transpeptidase n=1 Tax=Actinoallomurus purpureus TaxID=478114 RepID=UPI002093DC95|nr:Ig-like domain-containing protein [Actinoallomurus purpureus]MCO6004366.1 Ig-like domain-containing protein [Actinoallomurus purpureus]
MKIPHLAVAAALVLAAGCSSSEAGTNGRNGTGAPDATVRISAADGKVRPDQGVTVTVSGGTLTSVTGASGQFTADRTSWRTTWTLKPGASYTVTATARNPKGKVTAVTRTFRTVRAPHTLGIASVTPAAGEKVGVGMPIIVDFTGPVANRANVEKALEVRAAKGDEGAWSWISDRRVVYRTHKYWHPHQAISFTAHLAGVRAAKDTYGVRDVTRSFAIGASNVTVANAKTHYMTVNHDGTAKKFKISAGKGDRPDTITTNGIHLTREKDRVTTMTATCQGKPGCDNYKEEVHLAVRITWGGEYVHQSVNQYYYLGRQNASHGCVRTTPEGARYFFDISQLGDIVDVTGTTRRFADEPYADDWKFWTRSWRQWLAGSALR